MFKSKQIDARIKQISDDVKRRVAEFQGSEHAHLQMTARLAELHEAVSERAELSTRRIVCLTFSLCFLTIGLLWYTILLYQETKEEKRSDRKAEHYEFRQQKPPK